MYKNEIRNARERGSDRRINTNERERWKKRDNERKEIRDIANVCV